MNIREARPRLCELITTGKPVLITNRNRPAAVLIPLTREVAATAKEKRKRDEQAHAALTEVLKKA